jgi:hypothetical protein
MDQFRLMPQRLNQLPRSRSSGSMQSWNVMLTRHYTNDRIFTTGGRPVPL